MYKTCPKEMPIGRPRNDLGLKCPGGVWAEGGDPQLGGALFLPWLGGGPYLSTYLLGPQAPVGNQNIHL